MPIVWKDEPENPFPGAYCFVCRQWIDSPPFIHVEGLPLADRHGIVLHPDCCLRLSNKLGQEAFLFRIEEQKN